MDRERNCDRRRTERFADGTNIFKQTGDSVGSAEAISLNRPHGIFQRDHCGIESLEFAPGECRIPVSIGIEVAFEFNNLQCKTVDQVGRRTAKACHLEQCPNSCHAPQQAISIGDRMGGIGHWSDRNRGSSQHSGQQLRGRFEAVTDLGRARRLAK